MTPSPEHRRPSFPARVPRAELRRVSALLRTEAVGGALLVGMAVIALVWANSPFAPSYFALRDLPVGYAPWHLQLTLGDWAADGLLAVFFFLVGLELKREAVSGDLRDLRTAIVPVVAACGGVVVPALIYLAVVWSHPELRIGWATPTATDIAFAVAVLALVGSHLPAPLRIFLLTLAVVDDLIAIVIIGVFYTTAIDLAALGGAVAVIALYGLVARRYQRFFRLTPAAAWLVLLPIGVLAWVLVHASGVHPTIAGVALALTVPVRPPRGQRASGEATGLAEVFEHRFRPLSTGVAVPVFAFFAAGVSVGGSAGLAAVAADPVAWAVIAGLVVGKPAGILLSTRAITAATRARLDPAVRWIDLAGVGMLAGIGFTVSLLVADLSFAPGSVHRESAKLAVLVASVTAAALAAVVLLLRNRQYRRSERPEA